MYVAFDVLYRTLRERGLEVQYVRNFTDVDDKIIARAAESGEDPEALSQRCAPVSTLCFSTRPSCHLFSSWLIVGVVHDIQGPEKH